MASKFEDEYFSYIASLIKDGKLLHYTMHPVKFTKLYDYIIDNYPILMNFNDMYVLDGDKNYIFFLVFRFLDKYVMLYTHISLKDNIANVAIYTTDVAQNMLSFTLAFLNGISYGMRIIMNRCMKAGKDSCYDAFRELFDDLNLDISLIKDRGNSYLGREMS